MIQVVNDCSYVIALNANLIVGLIPVEVADRSNGGIGTRVVMVNGTTYDVNHTMLELIDKMEKLK